MERVDCNKNHLRYKLTQYLSHLICKSRQCILINISSVPFRLKLNLQPEQGEQSAQWCVWGSWVLMALERLGMLGWSSRAAMLTAQYQAGHLSTHQHQARGTELHIPTKARWKSILCKHTLNRDRSDTALADELGSSRRIFQETGHFICSETFHLLQTSACVLWNNSQY